LRPNFPEDIAPHPLLNFVALEIIGVKRFTDNNLGPTELIALRRFLRCAQLSCQFCYLFLKQVRDVLSYGVKALKPRHLIFQELDTNIPVRALLRAWTNWANGHFWLPILERRHLDPFHV
jgi:hypothetical protein